MTVIVQTVVLTVNKNVKPEYVKFINCCESSNPVQQTHKKTESLPSTPKPLFPGKSRHHQLVYRKQDKK